MRDNCYYDEQTLYKFFKTLTEIKGVGPELAGRIITEIQNNGFLIRERSKNPTSHSPKAYRGAQVAGGWTDEVNPDDPVEEV